MTPVLIYLSLSIFGLGFSIAKHGQPREPFSLWGQLFAMAITWLLLYWGGFFEPILRHIQ